MRNIALFLGRVRELNCLNLIVRTLSHLWKQGEDTDNHFGMQFASTQLSIPISSLKCHSFSNPKYNLLGCVFHMWPHKAIIQTNKAPTWYKHTELLFPLTMSKNRRKGWFGTWLEAGTLGVANNVLKGSLKFWDSRSLNFWVIT